MCGLITSISYNKKHNNVEKVVEQYEKQAHRGRQGFGFVAVTREGIRYARGRYWSDIRKELDKLDDTFLLMFHHRIPTSSPNSIDANHPIFIRNKKNLKYRYFLIHNGHIANSDELEKVHGELGISYKSYAEFTYTVTADATLHKEYTDSEALGYELALFAEGKIPALRTRGGVACFLLQIDERNAPRAMFFFRNTNPIKFYNNQDGCFFSSEGLGEEIESNQLYTMRFDKPSLKKEELKTTLSLDFLEPVVVDLEENEEVSRVTLSELLGEDPDDNLEAIRRLPPPGMQRRLGFCGVHKERSGDDFTDPSVIEGLLVRKRDLVTELEETDAAISDKLEEINKAEKDHPENIGLLDSEMDSLMRMRERYAIRIDEVEDELEAYSVVTQ